MSSPSVASRANVYSPSLQFWGLGLKQKLHLPECTVLNLYRSDDLHHLEVWAPKLETLSLQSCYSLDHVRLAPKEGTSVTVNVKNASINRMSLRHLEQHPRVDPEGLSLDHQEFEDMEDYNAANMVGGDEYANILQNIMGEGAQPNAEMLAVFQQAMQAGYYGH